MRTGSYGGTLTDAQKAAQAAAMASRASGTPVANAPGTPMVQNMEPMPSGETPMAEPGAGGGVLADVQAANAALPAELQRPAGYALNQAGPALPATAPTPEQAANYAAFQKFQEAARVQQEAARAAGTQRGSGDYRSIRYDPNQDYSTAGATIYGAPRDPNAINPKTGRAYGSGGGGLAQAAVGVGNAVTGGTATGTLGATATGTGTGGTTTAPMTQQQRFQNWQTGAGRTTPLTAQQTAYRGSLGQGQFNRMTNRPGGKGLMSALSPQQKALKAAAKLSLAP
jgi:hypothetical protein